MLKYPPQPERRHFVLVFDAIDRQRDAPPTLLPALGRLSEITPCLTTVFIMTNPPPNSLRTSFVAHVHFPNYHKAEFVKILSAAPPQALPNSTAAETAELWTRFCGAVHDALTKSAARTLPAFQLACNALWRRFTAPIREGNLGPRDFTKLLIASRVHFQDETLLDPGIIRRRPAPPAGTRKDPPPADTKDSSSTRKSSRAQPQPQPPPPTHLTTQRNPEMTSLAALLPSTARVLLIAAYLASHNATRHDLTLFSTYHHTRRRRRGGAGGMRGGGGGPGRPPRSKHRKIARKLLGAHAFVLERMMAIFNAVRQEWGLGGGGGGGSGSGDAVDADVGMALATLSSLRLLVRAGGAGGGDPLDRGGKWRVNVGWEVIRSLGRSMDVEVEEWLIE